MTEFSELSASNAVFQIFFHWNDLFSLLVTYVSKKEKKVNISNFPQFPAAISIIIISDICIINSLCFPVTSHYLWGIKKTEIR